jgi:hypothetical protein
MPRQSRQSRRLRQARWQMDQMAREIDALRKRLEDELMEKRLTLLQSLIVQWGKEKLNNPCPHCFGAGGYWTGDGRNEPREWEACECQEVYADPFAPDIAYACEHCRREFTGQVFEQYDTGAPICPDCWREGKR